MIISSLDSKENGFGHGLFELLLHHTDETSKLPNRHHFRLTAVLAAAEHLATCTKTNKVVGFSRNGTTSTEIPN